MLREVSRCLCCHSGRELIRQTTRSTYVLKHIFNLPVTPPGHTQKPPGTKQQYQLYEVLRHIDSEEQPNLDVILTEYVEGYGNRGDIVSLPPEEARNEFLLPLRAVYATEYNRQLYQEEKRRAVEEGKLPIPLSKYCLTIARNLQSKTIPVNFNMFSEWTMSKRAIYLALRQMEVGCEERNIILPPTTADLKGPEGFESQSRLFRFYIVLNNLIIVPCIGRVLLVDASRDTVRLTDAQTTASDEALAAAGLRREDFYVHKEDFGQSWTEQMILELMQGHGDVKDSPSSDDFVRFDE